MEDEFGTREGAKGRSGVRWMDRMEGDPCACEHSFRPKLTPRFPQSGSSLLAAAVQGAPRGRRRPVKIAGAGRLRSAQTVGK
jgi:hypothetical protein